MSKKKKIIIGVIVGVVVLTSAAVALAFGLKGVSEADEPSTSDVSVDMPTKPSTQQATSSTNNNTSDIATEASTKETTTKKNSGETTTKKKPESTAAPTTVKNKKRSITFNITLPQANGVKDTLEILINNEIVSAQEVYLKGNTITFVTEKQYEGEIVAVARLTSYGAFQSAIVKANENEKNIKLPLNKTEDNVVEDV